MEEFTAEDGIDPYEVAGLSNGFMFDYEFTLPKSSRGHRESKPFKIVTTEEYYWTDQSLLGTVGGTLGLMVGFSLHTTATVIIESCFKILGMRSNSMKTLPAAHYALDGR